ncbi:hypothetical protein OPKNFCMD_1680 [Methylobacterium crusticola]|uniref:STAS domain-containing protein n=1 Tax=Methylobacterium crusticola TaxID=1697972 RepID=A0ABQ4QVI2_9HYPH|nr:hypothetical protein [Methylobacterium crusticola]GJD48954.1 hypothetical protein OPKNFCMD_1680 [Methylobacterium crusticola]
MSVRRASPDEPDGLILLEGACPVEDAETLAGHLAGAPRAAVDWSGCTRLHTAVFQVLLRLRPPLRGTCGDPFAARWLAPALGAGAGAGDASIVASRRPAGDA